MASTQKTQPVNRARRVLVALGIAGVLIVGAYLVSNPQLFAPSTANAQSTQALLAAYAEQKGPNGLPLWEDQLIATASSTAWSNATASSTDQAPQYAPAPTAAAGTLTDEFAQQMFMQYMNEEGGTNPSDQDIDTFAANEIQQLAQNHTQTNVYSEANIQVGGSGAAALTAYAAAASNAIANNTVDTQESELDYFTDAVEKNDTSELAEVAAIGKAYSGLAPALMQIPVPTEAEVAHLEIANAMARLGEDISDMSAYNTDPLRAYLGLSAYQADAESLAQGFSDMATVFQTENVTLPQSNPGYTFYILSMNAQAQSAATAAGNSQ